jgi:hypothetical protein
MAKNGQVTFRNSREARKIGDLNKFINANPFKIMDDYRPIMRMTPSKFKFLVEGTDFRITPTGEIILKH